MELEELFEPAPLELEEEDVLPEELELLEPLELVAPVPPQAVTRINMPRLMSFISHSDVMRVFINHLLAS